MTKIVKEPSLDVTDFMMKEYPTLMKSIKSILMNVLHYLLRNKWIMA